MARAETWAGPIRRLFHAGTMNGLREGALVGRIADQGDPAAIEAIVGRHGPMVLQVCRRFLRDPHDVDDAFQATFLVLVRRAGSLRRREAIGPWLYGVALRVATRARARSARAATVEADPEAPDRNAVPPADAAERSDESTALHEELARLPEAYRAPLVLCYFEGLTHDEAADRLRWPVGTVRGRLARGRDRLRGRLSRRGVGPAALAWIDGPRLPLPAVSARLLDESTRLITELIRTGSLGALPATSAVTLARGALAMTIWTSWKIPATLAAVAALGVGAGLAASADPPEKPDATAQTKASARSSDAPATTAKTSDRPAPAEAGGGPDEAAAIATKIRAAQEAYDRDLAALTVEQADSAAEAAVLDAQVEAVKTRIGENFTESLRLGLLSNDDVTRQRNVRLLELEAVSLSERLKSLMRSAAQARRREDEAQQKLATLEARPRPTDRLTIGLGDTLIVEVLEALPGRPISGERLVRPDGRISLGFYGEIYVAGLTTTEVKERVIQLLLPILADETLGLVTVDPTTDKQRRIAPRDSGRVFVDFVSRPEPGWGAATPRPRGVEGRPTTPRARRPGP